MNTNYTYRIFNNLSSIFYIFLSVLAVLLGGIIYILFRPSEPVFFSWISAFGFDSLLLTVRQYSHYQNLLLPEWIVFSLPNGLWAFAYSLLIMGIWWGSKSVLRYFWIASVPLLVLGFEILQYVGIIHGTFCLEDIAFGVAGIITGIIFGIKITKQINHEKDTF